MKWLDAARKSKFGWAVRTKYNGELSFVDKNGRQFNCDRRGTTILKELRVKRGRYPDDWVPALEPPFPYPGEPDYLGELRRVENACQEVSIGLCGLLAEANILRDNIIDLSEKFKTLSVDESMRNTLDELLIDAQALRDLL
jgi:hypothetical protein